MFRKIGWPITLIVLIVGGYYGWTTFGYVRYHNKDPKFSFRIIGGWKPTTSQAQGFTTITFSAVSKESKQDTLWVTYAQNTTNMNPGGLKPYAQAVAQSEYGVAVSDETHFVERTDVGGRAGYIARGPGSDRRKRPATIFGVHEGYIFIFKSPREDFALRAADSFKFGK